MDVKLQVGWMFFFKIAWLRGKMVVKCVYKQIQNLKKTLKYLICLF